MANLKISELTAASTLTGVELVEAVQGGLNVQTTAQEIANLAPGGSVSDWGDIGGTLSDQTDLQTALDAKGPLRETIRTITDNITLALSDLYKTIVVNAATQKTITIPLEATVAFAQGDWFYVEWADGAVGQPTLAPVSGSVTINSSSTGYTVPVENSKIYCVYRGSNQWIVENGGIPRSSTTWVPTLTGFSGTPTNLCRYSIDGKHMAGYLNISGTSNATTFTFTLPSGVLTTAFTGQRFTGFVTNNGTSTTTGMFDFIVNSNVVNVYRDATGTAFTTSGTKGGVVSFVIEIQ